jgi:hypothetical protein
VVPLKTITQELKRLYDGEGTVEKDGSWFDSELEARSLSIVLSGAFDFRKERPGTNRSAKAYTTMQIYSTLFAPGHDPTRQRKNLITYHEPGKNLGSEL